MQVDKNVRYVGGARNPYALAELISGQKIDWETMSSLEKRQKLEKIFNSPYEKLFSPQHDSPLYSDQLKIKR